MRLCLTERSGITNGNLGLPVNASCGTRGGTQPPKRVPRGKCLDECDGVRSPRHDEVVITGARRLVRGRPESAPLAFPPGDCWAPGCPPRSSPTPALALLGDPRPPRVPVRRAVLKPVSGRLSLRPGDPGIGRRLRHALSDQMCASGGSTRLADALGRGPTGHAVGLGQRPTGSLSRPRLRSADLRSPCPPAGRPVAADRGVRPSTSRTPPRAAMCSSSGHPPRRVPCGSWLTWLAGCSRSTRPPRCPTCDRKRAGR